ncbi:MAG: CHRD domain-containing protein [Thermoleophilia bacterium]|jgi:hypothetical protein
MEPQDEREALVRERAKERARRRRARQVRRRRLVFLICLVCLIALIVGLSVGLSGSDDAETSAADTNVDSTSTTGTNAAGTSTTRASTTYTARLTGDQSVPPVETTSTGTLTLTYDAATKTLGYVLNITEQLPSPSTATIYEGAAGTSGAAIVNLPTDPPESGQFTGILTEGQIKTADLTGSLQGKTIQDLLTVITSGSAYVSVGNESNPVDAIRGRIE